MAHKKNKTEILDRIITKVGLSGEFDWDYWDYDDYDYHGYCDCYMCMSVDYEYLPDEMQPKPIMHISKRGIRVSLHTLNIGKFIDMKSIYSKDELRQKRINHILGIESMIDAKTTLGDILIYK